MFRFDDPFFDPLWIRVAVVAVALGWALFEFVSGAPFWGVIFLALGGWAFYGLFMVPRPERNGEKDDG